MIVVAGMGPGVASASAQDLADEVARARRERLFPVHRRAFHNGGFVSAAVDVHTEVAAMP